MDIKKEIELYRKKLKAKKQAIIEITKKNKKPFDTKLSMRINKEDKDLFVKICKENNLNHLDILRDQINWIINEYN